MTANSTDKIKRPKGVPQLRFLVPFVRLAGGRSDRLVRLARDNTALILLVGLVVIGGTLSDVFLMPRNLLNIMSAVSILGIVSLGQTALLITCNFDMSVSSVVGLSGIITVLAQVAGWDLAGSMALGIAGGLAVGLLNGLLVVCTGANPFLITLGTASLAYATSLTLTHSQTFYATIPAFNILGRGGLFGLLQYSVLLFLVLAVVLEVVFRRTIFGRCLYVIGFNETTGRLSGLPTRSVKVAVFALSGGMAALAGLVMTARTGSTVASAGAGMEFDSIIASVLGGTSLFGGRGGALRTIVGVLVLGVLNNLLVLLGVPFESQQIAKGIVFLVVVWTDSVLRHP
jgi:ribose transport system permease protein